MSDSLLTAVIAAVTALVASGMTSWLALRGVLRQAEVQREVAAQDHAERRAEESRTAQTDACIQFIETAIRCAALVQRTRSPGMAEEAHQDRLEAAQAGLSELIRAQAVLSVAGPSSVAVAATEARWSLDREFAAVLNERAGAATAEVVHAAGDARRRAVGRVGGAARRAFGSDDGQSLAAPCVGGVAPTP